MKNRVIRGYWATLMLLLGLGLVSCSGQQQDQEGLEQEEQGLDGNEDVDQQEGNNDFNQENQGNFNSDFGQGNDGNLQLNQSDMQNFGGGDSLLANEASQDGAGNASENDLSNIISEMNQLSPEGGEPLANNMSQDNQGDSGGEMLGQASMGGASGSGVVTGIAGAPAGPGLPEMGSKLSYIVVSGDTLGKISAKIFGGSERWQELAENSGIENPSMIFPGDIIYYQLTEESLSFVTTYQSLARQEVTVQKGDTLATIAKEFYGDPKQWKYIWRQNGQIANPHQVEIGTKLYFVKKNAEISLSIKNQSKESKEMGEGQVGSYLSKIQVKARSHANKLSV